MKSFSTAPSTQGCPINLNWWWLNGVPRFTVWQGPPEIIIHPSVFTQIPWKSSPRRQATSSAAFKAIQEAQVHNLLVTWSRRGILRGGGWGRGRVFSEHYNHDIEGSDKQLLGGDGREIEESTEREGKILLSVRGKGPGAPSEAGGGGTGNQGQKNQMISQRNWKGWKV